MFASLSYLMISIIIFCPFFSDYSSKILKPLKDFQFGYCQTLKMALLKHLPDSLTENLRFCRRNPREKAFTYAMENLEERTDLLNIIRSIREIEASFQYLLSDEQRDFIKDKCKRIVIKDDKTVENFSSRHLKRLRSLQ